MSDTLTEMLRGLRLDGVEYGRCQPCAPWATNFPSGDAARFHFVAAGYAWLKSPSGECTKMTCGDAVLLPRGGDHVLASEPGLETKPFASLPRKTLCDGIVDVECQGTQGENKLFFGVMRFNVDKHHPLLQMMPEVMQTRDLAASEPTGRRCPRSEGDDALAVAVVEAVHDVLHALPLLPVTIVLEQAELPRAEGCEVGEHDAAPHDHELRRERPLGAYPEEVERGQACLVVMHALQR